MPVQPVEITNIAKTIFDFNPPVITEPSVLVTEFSTGVLEANRTSSLHLTPDFASKMVLVEMADAAFGGGVMRVFTIDGRSVLLQGSVDQRATLNLSARPVFTWWWSAIATGPWRSDVSQINDGRRGTCRPVMIICALA